MSPIIITANDLAAAWAVGRGAVVTVRVSAPVEKDLLAAADKHFPLRALEATAMIGELTLDGRLRCVPGVLPMTMAAAARALGRPGAADELAAIVRTVAG